MSWSSNAIGECSASTPNQTGTTTGGSDLVIDESSDEETVPIESASAAVSENTDPASSIDNTDTDNTTTPVITPPVIDDPPTP